MLVDTIIVDKRKMKKKPFNVEWFFYFSVNLQLSLSVVGGYICSLRMGIIL
jgi:hypothetical protein